MSNCSCSYGGEENEKPRWQYVRSRVADAGLVKGSAQATPEVVSKMADIAKISAAGQ